MAALRAASTRGMLPAMNPAEALGIVPKTRPSDAQPPASAPEAVAWLSNPTQPAQRLTQAQRLMEELRQEQERPA